MRDLQQNRSKIIREMRQNCFRQALNRPKRHVQQNTKINLNASTKINAKVQGSFTNGNIDKSLFLI